MRRLGVVACMLLPLSLSNRARHSRHKQRRKESDNDFASIALSTRRGDGFDEEDSLGSDET